MVIREASPQSRADWINSCHFHDLGEAEVLREVARRASGQKALVLLDLDSTLYEVGSRTFRILREWLESEGAAFPGVRSALSRLEHAHVGYSLKDTFGAVGLDWTSAEVNHAWDAAKKFWAKRFFTSAYLKFDQAYPGAAKFARELYDVGAEIVYLTGRDEPGMGEGTRRNLHRDGFPWEVARTHLLLKKDFAIDDLHHKQQAADYIRRNGTLVASFENEPMNLVALYEIFPEAMHVFVDTIYSDRPAMPCRGLYRIKGFGA